MKEQVITEPEEEEVFESEQEQMPEPPGTSQQPSESPSSYRPFALSSTLDGNSYTARGISENNVPLAFTIIPHESVQFDMLGGDGGTMEMTLPKKMINGIHTVVIDGQEIQFQRVGTTDTSTTIKFTAPDDATSLAVYGAMVIPEFPITILVLGIVMAMILFVPKMGLKLSQKQY